MKAVICTRYGGPEVLQIKEVPKPVPGEGEILVKIIASAVTAVEPIDRAGKPYIARIFSGITKPKHPVQGEIIAGIVEETGEGVTLFKKGDEIYGSAGLNLGAHGEYVALSQKEALALKPENLSFEESAAICDGGLTALPFLRDKGQIKKGMKVLVNGASGSVGSSAVLLACHFGAETTGVSSGGNSEMVKELGARNVIDYTKEDFTRGKEAYDIIFDAVGKSSFSRCKKALKERGIYMTTVPSLGILLPMLFSSKGKKATFAATGLRPPEEKVKDLYIIKDLAEKGIIKPIIDRIYPMDEIAKAHTYVAKGHKKGNVILKIQKP